MSENRHTRRDAAPGQGENRLAREKSPYLLQHADNPVDWFPWGDEAFERARSDDRPIFLSIGYSSCHWCHVMEHESFEDEEVAAFLNEHFVSIKVDREERPDVDDVFMAVCQAMTGSGGWPLSVIMTPEGEPFFAGTYFPKKSRMGMPGFLDILRKVTDLWQNDRSKLTGVGDRVMSMIRESARKSHTSDLGEEVLAEAYRLFERTYDEDHGGFGAAPKFPSPHIIGFLLRWWARSGEEKALVMAKHTMDAMANGGIFDHLGFGFHRYSTDERWLVPHFEKMLYDQAMIVIAATDLYQATGEDRYRTVARNVLTYVLRDMTSPDGGFFSAEDADSEGQEGKHYTWTPSEIDSVLGPRRGELFSRFFGVDSAGDLDGRSVLRRSRSIADAARERGVEPEELARELEGMRRELLDARNDRVRPLKDDKVLVDWNGLMIAACARAARVLDEPAYVKAADEAVRFIFDRLMGGDGGRLLHRYRDGEAGIDGYLDDYAFLVLGLCEMYETTFDTWYLKRAITLTDEMLVLFWDAENGGFYLSRENGDPMIVRRKEAYDGAIPSGNSVAAHCLLRLGAITMRTDLAEKGQEVLRSFGEVVKQHPTGFAHLLSALDTALGPVSEIVVAGDPDQPGTVRMLEAIRSRYLPRSVVLLNPPGGDGSVGEIAPFVKDQTSVDGETVTYVCRNHSCSLPTTDVDRMLELIGRQNTE